MKKIMVCAVIISALVLLASCATLGPESSFEIQQTVVEVEGASSDELFVRANWMDDSGFQFRQGCDSVFRQGRRDYQGKVRL